MKTKTILARITSAASLLPLLLLLAPTATVQAQDYDYTTNDGTITITHYNGPDTDVTIPDTIDGLPVTSIGFTAFIERRLTSVTIPHSVTTIGEAAFMACTSMTNARIGNGVTSIEDWTFHGCTRLTNVTIGHSVTNIGEVAFYECGLTSVNIPNSVLTIGRRAFFQSGLTNLNIGNSVTSIGEGAFCGCTNLITATIGNSVTNIGDYAFALGTTNLAGVYFKGNAPSLGLCVFQFESLCHPTAYYLPGTTGWDTTFGGLSTALWNPQAPTTDPTFGVRANQFGFTVTGTSNLVIVVEACTNLTNPAWTPLRTTTLTNGSSYFSDPQWTNYPARFYRFRSP